MSMTFYDIPDIYICYVAFVLQTGNLAHTFQGDGVVYDVQWNSKGDKLAACFSSSLVSIMTQNTLLMWSWHFKAYLAHTTYYVSTTVQKNILSVLVQLKFRSFSGLCAGPVLSITCFIFINITHWNRLLYTFLFVVILSIHIR